MSVCGAAAPLGRRPALGCGGVADASLALGSVSLAACDVLVVWLDRRPVGDGRPGPRMAVGVVASASSVAVLAQPQPPLGQGDRRAGADGSSGAGEVSEW